MRIGLIMDESQALKNSMVFGVLSETVVPMGHEAVNIGMFSSDDDVKISFVQQAILAALLIETKAVDFVISGCGTGIGALMALNAFPNICAGFVQDSTDAYLFNQINGGNAVALAFGARFGFEAEINLKHIFEKLFAYEFGAGYPKHRAEAQQRYAKILNDMKFSLCDNLIDGLKKMDENIVKSVVASKQFQEIILKYGVDGEAKDYVKSLI